MQKALFLDRDGVVCEATPRGEGMPTVYLLSKEQFNLVPHIGELIRVARGKGYAIVMVTNQPAVAKGMLTREQLDDIHTYMKELLGDAAIDAIYVCPHERKDECECRKPKPTMLLRAAREMNLDLRNSVYVGDSDKDILAGKAAGVKTVFLRNQWNDPELAQVNPPDHIVFNLQEVCKLLDK